MSGMRNGYPRRGGAELRPAAEDHRRRFLSFSVTVRTVVFGDPPSGLKVSATLTLSRPLRRSTFLPAVDGRIRTFTGPALVARTRVRAISGFLRAAIRAEVLFTPVPSAAVRTPGPGTVTVIVAVPLAPKVMLEPILKTLLGGGGGGGGVTAGGGGGGGGGGITTGTSGGLHVLGPSAMNASRSSMIT